MSAVIYLICLHSELKDRIILTRHMNSHHVYLFNLFCNGDFCLVAVDDTLPVEKNSMSYLNISGSKDLWPILLEKAWVKQIGSYSKARGLSP